MSGTASHLNLTIITLLNCIPGGHSRMSADIFCLYYDPVYPFLFQNFNVKFHSFCALCAHFKQFYQFSANFHSNLTKFTPNYNYFENLTPKKAHSFLNPIINDPFFTKSYNECLLFSFSCRNIPVTFIFECDFHAIYITQSDSATFWFASYTNIYFNVISTLHFELK